MSYYDGTKILSMLDINRKQPELYMISTNRTGGKTTYFNRLMLNRFINKNKKFALLYRFNYEIEDAADTFFKDIKELFFPNDEMTSKTFSKNFVSLFFNGIECGYGIPLNAANLVKKKSHFFSDVDAILFDEFQSEDDVYLPDEITKFLSVHTSIARGRGKQHRYVPVYMISNPVSIINPYYNAFGITERLTDETRFLRGDGFVVEQGFVEAAAEAQKESGIYRALKDQQYSKFNVDGIYLNDNKSFIERPQGKSEYWLTIRCKNVDYGLHLYESLGIMYVDKNVDRTYPMKISVTTEDMKINYITLKANRMVLERLRYFFHHGAFRFKDLSCKQAILIALSN